MLRYLASSPIKKIQINNSFDDIGKNSSSAIAGAVEQEEIRRMEAEMADEGSSGEEDDDYAEGQGSSSESDSSGSESDEDLAEVVDESDLDIPAPKKKKKVKEESSKYAPATPKTKQGVRTDKKRKSTTVEKPSTSKKKSKKDSNAPKKPLTAYMFFMSTMRSKIKEQNPDMSFADLSRQVASEYKKLSPEEKQKYDNMASDDKDRYANEMKNYTPPSDDDEVSNTPKAKKDPNAPKRGLTAYNFFVKENRDQVKQDNPDASFGDISKILGEKYKKLSDVQREKLDSKASKDKDRYIQEMKHYTPALSSAKKKGKPVKDKNAPKKNLTSFLIYSNANRDKFKEKNPDLSFTDLAKLIGQQFKSLSEEEKKKWDAKAKKDKERYQQEMKEYERKKAPVKQESSEESAEEASSSEEESGSGDEGSDSDDSDSS